MPNKPGKIYYRPTISNDLMQVINGVEVGTLGIRLSPDTADLFAKAPCMKEEIEKLRAELAAERAAHEQTRQERDEALREVQDYASTVDDVFGTLDDERTHEDRRRMLQEFSDEWDEMVDRRYDG